jgi:chromosome segregation ATPase
METYLPIIKTILSDWILLTLNNPWYAAALATVVWLLTAIIYSIKVASLKKKNIASEKARIEMQNNLNTAQQQMQKMQEELTANTGQMQKDKQLAQNEAQRAAGLEEQLSQRNKQIAGIIQSLATSFDPGERPLPVTEDVKAEGLWQQHDRVITLLTTRLRSEQQSKIELQKSYQTETLKRAEKEALIETLQTTLATQASQVSKLEQALEEQKSILQQQQDKAQQVLSQTLEKHLSELARFTELEQQALELVNARQHLTQLEEKLNAKDPLITQLEKNKSVDQVKVQTGGVTGKIKNLFGKTRQELITAEPESAETKQDEAEIQPAPSDVEQQPVSATKGQFGKLKNLFGKTRQELITAEPESAETKQDEAEIQPAPSDMEQQPVSATKGQFGKLKNLFGKAK